MNSLDRWESSTSQVSIMKEFPYEIRLDSRRENEDSDCTATDTSSLESDSVPSNFSQENHRRAPNGSNKTRRRVKTRLPVGQSLTSELSTRPYMASLPANHFEIFAKKGPKPPRLRSATIGCMAEATRRPNQTEQIKVTTNQQRRLDRNVPHATENHSRNHKSLASTASHSDCSSATVYVTHESGRDHRSDLGLVDDFDFDRLDDFDQSHDESWGGGEQERAAAHDRQVEALHLLSVHELEEKITALKKRLARSTDVLLGELCLQAELQNEATCKTRISAMDGLQVDMTSLAPYAKIYADTAVPCQRKKTRWFSAFS